MAFIPELGVGVVILTNSDKGAYINDAKRLLKLYLKEEKSSKLITSSTKKNKNTNDKSKPCTVNQIKGIYNSGDFVIQVTNPKKISFKQGPAKLKFTLKKGDSTVYTAKARVFKVIPINLKDQEFKFVSLNNHVYLKQVNVKSGSEIFAVMKDSVVDIPKTWKTAYGTYKIKSDYYTCTKCAFGNPEGTTLHLSEKKGLITFKLKAKGMSSTSYLNVISDSLCVTGGISRGCGETVKLLSNGNIYYSGFEFERR
jgi:hypothetical protein